MDTLVTTHELAEQLGTPGLHVLDATWFGTLPGADARDAAAEFAAALLVSFGLAGGGEVDRSRGDANWGCRHIDCRLGETSAEEQWSDPEDNQGRKTKHGGSFHSPLVGSLPSRR